MPLHDIPFSILDLAPIITPASSFRNTLDMDQHADELIVVSQVYDHAAFLRSFGLLAEIVNESRSEVAKQ